MTEPEDYSLKRPHEHGIGFNAPAESLAPLMQELLPLTRLLKHLQTHTAKWTVHEYKAKGVSDHVIALIKYAGVMCGDESGDQKAAVTRLLMMVDQALFTGDPEPDRGGDPCSIEGLAGFANSGRIDRLGCEEFYARFERDKEKQGLRIFSADPAYTIGEGDLPASSPTYAIGAEALAWCQLLPMTYLPLVPTREGRCMWNIEGSPREFKHEGSRVQQRGCVLLYGALLLYEPDAVFVLQES